MSEKSPDLRSLSEKRVLGKQRWSQLGDSVGIEDLCGFLEARGSGLWVEGLGFRA